MSDDEHTVTALYDLGRKIEKIGFNLDHRLGQIVSQLEDLNGNLHSINGHLNTLNGFVSSIDDSMPR